MAGFFLFGAGLSPATAEVRLPKVFSSHMVLQQDKQIVIWGWAQPNETVTVSLDSATAQAQANERGEWKVVLPAMKAGGPFTLKVSGSSSVLLDDVMIGEVWLCSGQSNMEMGIGMVHDAQKEIAAADQPGLRLLLVAHKWAPTAQTNIEGQWKVCTPKTVAEGGWSGFSAAAYFFGRELHKKLGVTIGLIDSTWGGTRIESWTPPEGFAATPALNSDYEKVQLADPRTERHQQRLKETLDETERWLASARQALADRALVPTMPVFPSELLAPHDVQNATALYNGMIHPLVPFALRGAIWYQGESNLGDGARYTVEGLCDILMIVNVIGDVLAQFAEVQVIDQPVILRFGNFELEKIVFGHFARVESASGQAVAVHQMRLGQHAPGVAHSHRMFDFRGGKQNARTINARVSFNKSAFIRVNNLKPVQRLPCAASQSAADMVEIHAQLVAFKTQGIERRARA